jgi:hypothetical protein
LLAAAKMGAEHSNAHEIHNHDGDIDQADLHCAVQVVPRDANCGLRTVSS